MSMAQGLTDSPEVGVPGLYPGLCAMGFIWAFLDAFGKNSWIM
jgi:hypothetical protein